MVGSGGADEAFQLAYERLWAVASSTGRDPASAFEEAGLLLEPPGELGRWSYDATPPEARTFASTGGDGVHFSAVPLRDTAVVVMTVPMMFDAPNIAVGRDLLDFLSLGCRFGYFGLEGLAYQPAETILDIERAAEQDPAGDLVVISEEFDLRPLTDVGRHLAELAQLLHRN